MHREVALDREEANLGSLVNYAEPSISPQDLTSMSSTSFFPTESGNLNNGSEGLDSIMNDSAFGAFLDTDMLGPESMSEVPYTNTTSDWLAVDPLQGSHDVLELGQFGIGTVADAARYEVQLAPDDPTNAVSQSILDTGHSVEQLAASISRSKL